MEFSELSSDLKKLVSELDNVTDVQNDTKKLSASVVDLTSLRSDPDDASFGIETEFEICKLYDKARYYKAAAICVFPNHLNNLAQFIEVSHGSGVKIVTVNNFPHGEDSAESAAMQALKAIGSGICDEVDTVIDYEAVINGEYEKAEEKIRAVANVCREHNVKLKVILKASVYENAEDLRRAAFIAMENGADFVKTCSGKVPKPPFGNDGKPDVSDIISSTIIMDAVNKYNQDKQTNIGIKISGGVQTILDCQKYRELYQRIFQQDFVADSFRFGASTLLDNLYKKSTANVSFPAIGQPY